MIVTLERYTQTLYLSDKDYSNVKAVWFSYRPRTCILGFFDTPFDLPSNIIVCGVGIFLCAGSVEHGDYTVLENTGLTARLWVNMPITQIEGVYVDHTGRIELTKKRW